MDIKFISMYGLLNVVIKIVYGEEVIFTNEGENVTLICPFGNELQTIWEGPPSSTIISQGEKINPEKIYKMFVFRTNESNAYNLQIRNVTKEDIGTYSCSVLVSTKMYELKLYIDVQNVSLNPSDNPLDITEGATSEVWCLVNANADPSPSITWYLGSINITRQAGTNASSIIITGNRENNKMMLQCGATNGNKPLKTASTTLNVKYIPVVSPLTSNPYKVIEGHTATLECKVADGNPLNGITWKWFNMKNSSYILSTERTYTISKIHREKSGNYSCTATNSVGTSIAATIHLDIQYKPDVISNTSSPYRVEEGRTAELKCTVIAAKPNTSITWKWFKTDNPSYVLHNGSIYRIPDIQRNRSGFYNCTADNSIGTSVAATISVDIQYRPEVSPNTPLYRVIEGQSATLECTVTTANPDTIIAWKWLKVDNPNFDLFNGPNYTIPNIYRNGSGAYICTASNAVGTSEEAKTEVDVLYKPEIVGKPSTIVNENEIAILNREVSSNPLSNVSWFKGQTLLSTQWSVKNATYTIERAFCTNTTNFTVVASNSVERNVTSMVELIVNCKPRSFRTNYTLGVTDATGIEFSTTVIAYPKPVLELKHENGTTGNQIIKSIETNGINNFTIHLHQAVVNQSSFGVYHLIITNAFGNITIFLNVIPQRKPTMPGNIEIECEVARAKVQWTSAFNGGDSQSFTVFTFNGQQSDTISDKGEDEIHATYVQNLQSSTMYVFYVSARNRHGFSLSNNISCTTLAGFRDNLPLIAGGAAAGGIALAIIVIVIVVLLRRYSTDEKQGGKPQRLNNENEENADVDGLKENSLYVSAGPRDGDKAEVAVYAAVAKKLPQNDNNANLYADVKKSGRQDKNKGGMSSEVKSKKGLFKKDEKAKHKKGKKPKNRPGETDVYENSEDIALSSNIDNVYSNAGHKGTNKQKERGYKNKDGLLYVEVNFDGKQGQDNPVIHGEDEKTDYATVEFPMPSSVHNASGGEEL